VLVNIKGLEKNHVKIGVRHDVGVEPTIVIIRNAIYCAGYGKVKLNIHLFAFV
jgi:hypothetical protein